MRNRLQRLLSILCVLALVFGCVSLAAFAEETKEIRIITVEWEDEDNYDALRKASIEAVIDGQTVVLNDANNWVGQAEATAGAEWVLPDVEGYVRSKSGTDVTVVVYRHPVKKVPLSATVAWADNENASGLRPESVQLRLLADGQPFGAPATANEKNGWTVKWEDLPVTKKGSADVITYSLEQTTVPDGYTVAVAGSTVTNTLLTGTLSLQASVSGAPEGTDLSKLSLTVTGPDPKMPATLTLADFSGGSYSFGAVLPGAYLVEENNADTLVEDYEMDPDNSRVADAVWLKAGEAATLNFKYAYREPVEAEINEDPMAEVASLTIEILGPDPRMPMTITYSQFTDGKYELDGLVPGTYSVVERNAEKLVRAYTLTSDSVTGMTITVGKEGATAKLFNRYVPANTPTPEAELIDIPVTKTWNDNNNEDGNRPASITVHLYADGTIVDTHEMTAEEGWAWTFTEKPRTKEDGTEIVYTVNEEPVFWYATTINGYNIVNDYQPDVTTLTVSKVWNDDNNVQGYRPTSLAVTLMPVGKIFVLSEENGWTATASNLATKINGEDVTYYWTEQETLGYVLDETAVNGNATTFTNRIVRVPETPEGEKAPKKPGSNWEDLGEYDTALGLEVIINHVGDCFD